MGHGVLRRLELKDADAVCRQLGHGTASAIYRARNEFGKGSASTWMDEVACTGDEARLADCAFAGWGVHNCTHQDDTAVECNALGSQQATAAEPLTASFENAPLGHDGSSAFTSGSQARLQRVGIAATVRW